MSLTDYSGVDAPFGILELGSTFMIQPARERQQLQANDPLAFALPQIDVWEKTVKVEWEEDELRLIGVVRSGGKNFLNTFHTGKSFEFQTAKFRRGDTIDMETINYLRAPGKQQQLYGMKLVQDRLFKLISQCNLMWAYLRAQLMSGGINYTDRETGVSVVADAGIPATNFYTIGSNSPSTIVSSSVKWSDRDNATIVTDIENLLYTMKINGRVKPTHMLMSTAMRKAISQNAQVRAHLHGNTTTALYSLGQVQWDKDGLVKAICGVEIVEHYMLFDDWADDTRTAMARRYMWPVNKIAFFSVNSPELPGANLGHAVQSLGENPEHGPGMWVRTAGVEQLVDPTLPPHFAMQVGMAGLPVLFKPWWVHIVTACDVADITADVGTKYITAN